MLLTVLSCLDVVMWTAIEGVRSTIKSLHIDTFINHPLDVMFILSCILKTSAKSVCSVSLCVCVCVTPRDKPHVRGVYKWILYEIRRLRASDPVYGDCVR